MVANFTKASQEREEILPENETIESNASHAKCGRKVTQKLTEEQISQEPKLEKDEIKDE